VKHLIWLMALFLCWGARAAEDVVFPGAGIELAARLYKPEGSGPFPAVVLMHGCSGMWIDPGRPNRSYEDWARRLQDRGFIALLLDSFGPREEKEICTQKQRRVSESGDRPRDAYAALQWLAARPDVRLSQIHLLGWSNGGSAVLHALRPDAPGRDPKLAFRSAVAFYPGCAALARAPYRPIAPILIQAGGADDWTPARHCEALVRSASEAGSEVRIDVYPGAHHAFDRIDGRVRVRPDVRNLASPTGWGATVGPHPQARERARERTFRFLEDAR
jgi:dienelactone hydrolase